MMLTNQKDGVKKKLTIYNEKKKKENAKTKFLRIRGRKGYSTIGNVTSAKIRQKEDVKAKDLRTRKRKRRCRKEVKRPRKKKKKLAVHRRFLWTTS